MTLKELQKMIKEEFDAYMKEADDVDVSVTDSDVDTDEMGMDADGGDDLLRKIYDMLKDKFEAEEGEEESKDMDEADMEEYGTMEADMEEDMVGEVKDDEKKEEAADMEEGSDGYTGKAGKGGTGYDGKAGKGGTGYDAGSKALQERFQKLANIIK